MKNSYLLLGVLLLCGYTSAGHSANIASQNYVDKIAASIDAQKQNKPATATAGNIAIFDANKNTIDSGVKTTGFATAAQGAKADTAVQPASLATVATSGSYNDLANKPSIPAAYTLPAATATVRGGVLLGNATTQTVAANTPTASASRTYPVQANASGQMVVNVPWTDANTTYAAMTQAEIDTGTSTTARAITPQVLKNNLNTKMDKVTLATVATSGSYNDLANKPSIPAAYTLPAATNTARGGVMLGAAKVTGLTTTPGASATASRYYPVQTDNNDKLVVNVPWVDTNTNTTYAAGTSGTLGLMKLGSDTAQTIAANAVTATAARTYAVQNNASGQMVVNVPWVDTNTVYSLPAATAAARGGVLLGNATVQTVAANTPTTTASRTYPVQANASGQMVVNVPWTDANTTYGVATNTTNGLVMLGAAKLTGLTTTPGATATASRYYPVQTDNNNKLVVNVPWTDAQTSVSGNAGTATALQTARTITVNLGSTAGASFNGTANITPGVSGTLPLARGGTGATTAAAAFTSIVAPGGTVTGVINVPTPTLP